jgi:hypothetical protein
MQEESNVEKKEKGESLSGGESSAEYMAFHAGEEEGWRKEDETEKDTEGMGDKIKTGAKALKKKAEDPDKNLKTEYEKEKLKE